MSDNMITAVEQLTKALEAGNLDVAPSVKVQGAALQVDDMANVLEVVTFDNSHIKLQKMCGTKSVKNTLAQFNRQLSYGILGDSAQQEGDVGQEETSQYVRVVIPMAYYSHTRRVTHVANLVSTFDGVGAEDRSEADAAIKISGDIEADCFAGMDGFSNGGTFDGNPLAAPGLPNMHGLFLQIRQSDGQINAKDAMFGEFGSDETVVLTAGSVITQDKVEDLNLRSALNFGNGDTLVTDPVSLSAYNKQVFGKERIILAGSPTNATGGDLRRQWVSGGTVSVEATMFLRGKFKPRASRPTAPNAPAGLSNAVASSTTSFVNGDVFIYSVTAVSEKGESVPSATSSATITADGQKVTLTITQPSGGNPYRYYNVYRTAAGGASGTQKYIGRVLANQGTTTAFVDLGNRSPGFVTAALLDKSGSNYTLYELSPFSNARLANTDLSTVSAFFRFCSLGCKQPRKSVILDNIKGTL